MTPEELKAHTAESFERMFHQGDLAFIDEALDPTAVDHQEPDGTSFCSHLKQVVTSLRGAFPDLRFELHEMIAEGHLVACRATMTGTHLGRLPLGPLAQAEPNGAAVSVPHMYLFRYREDGRLLDLWHQWDVPALMRQVGLAAPPTRISA